MIDHTKFEQINADAVVGGQQIFITDRAVEDPEPLQAKFVMQTNNGFRAVLAGTKAGLPFSDADWAILVPKKYPLPEFIDVAMLIQNAVLRGNASFTNIATDILALITGEIASPVPMYQPNEAPVEEVAEPQVDLEVPADPLVEETYPPDTSSWSDISVP